MNGSFLPFILRKKAIKGTEKEGSFTVGLKVQSYYYHKVLVHLHL